MATRLLSILSLMLLLLCGTVMECRAMDHKIVVIPKGTHDQYWQTLKEGAMQAGKEQGAHVTFRGPRNSDDSEAQLRIIKSAMEGGVDAIVIAPNDISLAKDLLNEAVRKGIVVVLIDSGMDFDQYASFVASDNHDAGRKAADHMLSLLEEQSSVLLIRFRGNDAATREREMGFLEQVSAAPKHHRIIEIGPVGASKGKAYHGTIEAFQSHPHIKGVFAPAETPTLGALKALDELHLTGQVTLVGFDDTKEIRQALEGGLLSATVVQHPFQIGYLGVQTACDALDGKPVKRRIVTDTTLLSGEYHHSSTTVVAP